MVDEVRVTPQRGGQVRCPYCRDDVDVEAEDWVACRACLARQHTECWHGRCASCGGQEYLAASDQAPRPAVVLRGRVRFRAGGHGRLDVRRALREGWELRRHGGYWTIFGALALQNLASALSLGVAGGLFAGTWLMTLAALRGERFQLEDLWPRRKVGLALALSIFTLVVTLAGYAAFVVPGVIIGTLLAYALPLALERDRSFGEALSESCAGVLASPGPHLALGLLTLVATLVGIIPSFIVPFGGSVVSALMFPVLFGPWASAYRQVFEEQDE